MDSTAKRAPLQVVSMTHEQTVACRHTVDFKPSELALARDFARVYAPALRSWLAGTYTGEDFVTRFLKLAPVKADADAVRRAIEVQRTTGERLRALDSAVTTCCNLRCAGCSAAMAFEKPWFVELDQLDATLARLAELCGDRPPMRYELMGGEPLLHPRIVDLVACAHRWLPDTALHLVTNGLLLPDLSDRTLADLAALNCGVSVSVYGPGVYFDRFLFTNGEGNRGCGDCSYHAVTLVKNYAQVQHCGHTLLANGDLYFCGGMPTLEIIGKSVELPKLVHGPMGDVWSIFEAETLDQLLAFVNRPTCPMARHCVRGGIAPWRTYSAGEDAVKDYVVCEGVRSGGCE